MAKKSAAGTRSLAGKVTGRLMPLDKPAQAKHPTVSHKRLGSHQIKKLAGRKVLEGRFMPTKVNVVVNADALLRMVQRHVPLKPKVKRELHEEFEQALRESWREAVQALPKAGGLVPPGDEVLSTQEAADLVGVSRPFMAARIDAGDVPLYMQVGNQRRVLASEVRAWHERSKERRSMAMVLLARSIDDEYPDEER